MKRTWGFALSSLALIAAVLWLSLLTKPSPNLKIIACDVGQGDAMLITRGSMQILVDGGPNSSVVSCLSRHMPFWDRTIEAVVLTNPDADHYVGLIQVLRRYEINQFLSTEIDRETEGFKILKDLVAENAVPVKIAQKGTTLSIGLLSIDILSPTEQMLPSPGTPSNVLGSIKGIDAVNNYSVVMHLQYGNFDALLTGDIEDEASDLVAQSFNKQVEYLKVPHHGSKNGLSQKLLDKVNPMVAVISAGKQNRYGHPDDEVLGMLTAKDVKVLRTDELGDIVVETDGKGWQQTN